MTLPAGTRSSPQYVFTTMYSRSRASSPLFLIDTVIRSAGPLISPPAVASPETDSTFTRETRIDPGASTTAAGSAGSSSDPAPSVGAGACGVAGVGPAPCGSNPTTGGDSAGSPEEPPSDGSAELSALPLGAESSSSIWVPPPVPGASDPSLPAVVSPSQSAPPARSNTHPTIQSPARRPRRFESDMVEPLLVVARATPDQRHTVQEPLR